MSTKLTTSPIAGFPMLDSKSLELRQHIEVFRNNQTQRLLDGLARLGFDKITSTHVNFLGALDCADNKAADIARRLNLTRQAVHKIVREIETLGFITTVQNPELKNSKLIRFTAKGEELISAARRLYAELDTLVDQHFNEKNYQSLLDFLVADISEDT